MDNEVKKVIKKLSNNKEKNAKIVKKYLHDYDLNKLMLKCLDNVEINNYNKEKRLLMIEALLDSGADVNYSEYNTRESFNLLQHALNKNYSKELIFDLFDLLTKYNINLNNIDGWDDTFFDDIYRKNYLKINQITPLYKKLVSNGFDIFKTDRDYYSLDNTKRELSSQYIDKDEFIEEYRKDRKNKYEIRKNEIINEIITKYPNLDYRNIENQSLFHILVTCYYDEEMILDIIHTLFEKGIDINSIDGNNQNFIHTALKIRKHSNKFKYKLIKMSLDHRLDPNTLDNGKNNIIYNLIYWTKNMEIVPIYKLLVEKGFNKKKRSVRIIKKLS